MTHKDLTLTDRARQALAQTVTEQALQDLTGRYTDLTAVNNKTDLALAMSALGEFRSTRTAITKAGKEARDDANAFCKAVIAEEKRLIGIIQPEEARIQQARKVFEDEQERIRQQAAEQERQRIAAHKDRLNRIISTPAHCAALPTGEIDEHLATLSAMVIGEDWEEFRAEAEVERDRAVAMLVDMISRARAAEAEKAERERREAEEKAQRQAEAEALARQKAEQDRLAEQLRAQQAEIDRQQAELKAQQEAEQKRQADIERHRQETEQQQKEAQAQAELKAQQEAQAKQKATESTESTKKARGRKPVEPEAITKIRAWAKQHKVSPEALNELLALIRQYLTQQEQEAA